MNVNHLISAIKELCDEQNISVNKLSHQAQLTQSTIDSILKGKSKNPQMSTIQKLAKGFNLSLDDFLAYVDYYEKKPMTNEVFSKRLKMLRQQSNISIEEMQEKFGQQYLSYLPYEKGVRAPTFDTLIALADYFNVSLDYLCGRTDKPEVNR